MPEPVFRGHDRFFDRRGWTWFGVNACAQTMALLSIQSNGGGRGHGLESRGRTLDPFEKHFESYGYGWGSVYRFGGGIGVTTLVAYLLHNSGHHRAERWAWRLSIAHAGASTGYALTGSRQGNTGW